MGHLHCICSSYPASTSAPKQTLLRMPGSSCLPVSGVMSSFLVLTDILHLPPSHRSAFHLGSQSSQAPRNWDWFLLITFSPAVNSLLPLNLQYLAPCLFPKTIPCSSHSGFETLRCCLSSINLHTSGYLIYSYQALTSNSRLLRCLFLSTSHTNACSFQLHLLAFWLNCSGRVEEKETTDFLFFFFFFLLLNNFHFGVFSVDSILLFLRQDLTV
jgi:hypothetical protein